MGGITEIATSAPGYNSIRPNTCAPLAETLKLNGYCDRAVRQVPRGAGLGDEPARPVRLLAERRRRLRVLLRLHRRGDEPVLPGALRGDDAGRARQDAGGGLPLHRGHDRQGDHVDPPAEGADGRTSRSSSTSRRARRTRRTTCPTEWSAKYKGKFDQGWDKLREETLARQKELGVIPPEAELTARPDGDPRLGRHAGRPEARARAPDGGLRRLPRAHRPPRRPARRRARGPRRSSRTRSSTTSSATTARAPRARRTARFNELVVLNGAGGARDDRSSWSRGSTSSARPSAYNHYAVGWAHAMDTPYQWTKQVASHWGGTRNGTIVHWPNGIEAKGEVRSQFHHVIDVAPTVLDAAGLPEPTTVARRPAEADRGREHALRVRRRRRRGAARDAVLRDVLQPRHLPQGLDRGHPPLDAVGDGPSCRRSPTTSGSSTTRTPTGARRTTSRPRCRRSSRS